jgi:hypothetical protein
MKLMSKELQTDWTPNYLNFEKTVIEKKGYDDSDWFLDYLEQYVKVEKRDGAIYVIFDFGKKKAEMLYQDLENILYGLKNSCVYGENKIKIENQDVVDFLLYFHLIEQTPNGIIMVDEKICKRGNASLATLLGHILVEKQILLHS